MDIMTTPHIAISQDVAGGKPRIAGHRITVQQIVIWHERMGLSADEIASEHGLTLADVYAALTYYYDHRQEIDEAILIRRIVCRRAPEADQVQTKRQDRWLTGSGLT